MIKINELIKEAHDNAVERRFYDCPECDGEGTIEGMEVRCYAGCHTEIKTEDECENCDGSGIDPNKNIGELLMLIVSKLGEALEAHRNNRFADWESYARGIQQLKNSCSMWKDMEGDMMFTKEGKNYFISYIKDTFEDEIADVFIQLFDLCGYLGIEPETHEDKLYLHKNPFINLYDLLLFITRCISEMQNDLIDKNNIISSALGYLNSICNMFNIPIEKHIKARMAYDKIKRDK